jgi:hypothetical protein
MSRISRRSRNRTEDKRYGHKQARQQTRVALEQERVPHIARGINWSSSVEQPPLPDASTGPPRPKKGGCKRNKYGPHVIEPWPRAPLSVRVFNKDTRRFEWVPTPYWCRPYHPPYRCANCGKGFYSIPRRGTVMKPGRLVGPSLSNYENEKQDEHFDLYNIRCRLLGLACRCNECNSVLS